MTRVALVIVALALAPGAARAAAYSVTPGGSDTNPGTAAQPWQTLQHAADAVAAGDTVTVEPGTYVGFSLCYDKPQDGTPTSPITFTAKPGVVINAKNAKTDDGINLEGCSYIVVQGFEVTGMLPRARASARCRAARTPSASSSGTTTATTTRSGGSSRATSTRSSSRATTRRIPPSSTGSTSRTRA